MYSRPRVTALAWFLACAYLFTLLIEGGGVIAVIVIPPTTTTTTTTKNIKIIFF